jgi:hypothetical protein
VKWAERGSTCSVFLLGNGKTKAAVHDQVGMDAVASTSQEFQAKHLWWRTASEGGPYKGNGKTKTLARKGARLRRRPLQNQALQ